LADDKIIIEFDGDIKALKAKLGSTQKEVSRLEKASKSIKATLGTVARAGAIGFTALTAAVGAAVNEAAKFERITTQFETLTGSAEEATKVVKDLQDFTAKTPFQFESVAKAGQTLLAFGFEVDNVKDKLREIGDVSSASGKDISELTVVYGQIAAQGKLTGERLNQLVEAAVPIGPALAKTMGVAEKSVRSLVSRGEVDFATFEKAFKSLSDEGGFAFEGMIKQSKTLEGVFSTVKDNVSLLAADAGKQLLPVIKELATQFLGLIQNLRSTDGFINAVKDTISGTTRIVLGAAQGFETFGKRVGAILATVSSAVTAALNLKFKQAVEIFKENDKAFREELLVIEQGYADKSKAIDEALYSKKQELANENTTKVKAKLAEETEIKAQAKLDENELLKELEDELQEQKLELETERQDQINQLVSDKLKERFDAKRAVEQDDIKSSIKENKLRMKEEVKYGKSVADARAFFRTKEVEGTRMLLDSLETLGKTGNKKLIEIAKAASIAKAIMNTAEGVTKALAFGPILGPALAGVIGAAGAVQIGVISGAKFADGGMYTGGIPGVDSLPAMLQQGELVVPKQSFEEVVNSVAKERNGESGSGGMMEVMIGFKDDAFEIIEEKILERRETQIGSL
jgi:tape measure domain-containing protein